MNQLQIFKSSEFGEIRTLLKDNEPWFVAKDVAEILGYSETNRMTSRLDSDESISTKLEGMNMNSTLINESGLYNAVLGSNKPEAKRFKKWVTSEVLPSIRKHGLYATEELLNDPDLAIKAFTALKEERERTKQLTAKIEQDKPLVMFAESCIASNDSLLVREVAKLASKKGIIIGEKRLWQKLREWGVVSPDNEPYQRAFDAGWFETRQGTYNTPYGAETYRTYKVTPKGQVYIIEKLKKVKEN